MTDKAYIVYTWCNRPHVLHENNKPITLAGTYIPVAKRILAPNADTAAAIVCLLTGIPQDELCPVQIT